MTHIIKTCLLSLAICAVFPAHAWTLTKEESHVSFISIKKNNIAESHRFTDISGAIENGRAAISIKPDSVDSRVPIRNERMREFLFKTELYPTIDVTANVADVMVDLKPGDSKLVNVAAVLTMHGHTEEILLAVRASLLSDKTMTVSSVEPVLIRAASFSMVEGIQKLSSLVNGLLIAESIPVSFSLTYTK